MKMTIQVVIEDADHRMPPVVKEAISLERNVEGLGPSTLGLKLDEAKVILAEVQTALVTAQATHFLERQCSCPECGTPYQKNGTQELTFRTLFGTIKLVSQRFYTCSCQKEKTQQPTNKQISFSPLAKLIPERTAPEFVYLQTKWAAIMSYGRTAQLLIEWSPFPAVLLLPTRTLSWCQDNRKLTNMLCNPWHVVEDFKSRAGRYSNAASPPT